MGLPFLATNLKENNKARGETEMFIRNDNFEVNATSISGVSNDQNEKVLLYEEKADSTTSVELSFQLSLSNDNVAGLIFGVRDASKPIENGYYSLTFSNNKFTLYRYILGPLGQTTFTYDCTYTQNMLVNLSLKSDSRLILSVNGSVIFDIFEYTYQGGYFGYLVKSGSATFNNYQSVVTHDQIGISNIEVSNTNLIYIPFLYGYDIPRRNLGEFNISLTPASGYTLYINGEETNTKLVNIIQDTRVTILAKNGTSETEYILNFRKGYNDSARPNFHKGVEKGFTNDPNGMVYDEMTGLYHIFYQYTKALDSDVLGNKNVPGDGSTTKFTRYWAHSISKDMIHWFDMPIAIYSYDGCEIFSGGCVVDVNNTSGLFTDNTPLQSRLCAFYTFYSPVHWERPINMSYSKDWGVTFETYGRVFLGSSSIYGDYRDPQVFWFEDEKIGAKGCWMMIFGGWTPLCILTSDNLLDWKLNCKPKGLDGQYLEAECPDLFKVKLGNDYKWVITMGGDYFVVGHFEKGNDGSYQFISESQPTLIYNNPIISNKAWNKGCTYAGIVFKSEKFGRPIMMSWIVDYLSDYVDDKYWNGYYTLPNELGLEVINGMYVLTKKPVEELKSLREDQVVNIKETQITPTTINPLSSVNLASADIDLQIDVGTAKEITLTVNKNTTDYYEIKYDVFTQLVSIKYHSSGYSCPWGDFNSSGAMKAPALLRDGILSLRVVIDTLHVETYACGMQLFESWFWQKGNAFMSLSIDEGSATIKSLEIYKMGGIY